MYNRIIKRIGAGLIAMSCAFSVLGATIPSISANAAMTTENSAFLTAGVSKDIQAYTIRTVTLRLLLTM